MNKQTEAQLKWRKSHKAAWNKQKQRYYARGATDTRNYKKQWTKEEDNVILAREMPDRILAKKLGRSVQAIQVRRSKLKANTV